jgi:hypothetical protein
MNKVLVDLHLWKKSLGPQQLKEFESGLLDRICKRIKGREKSK